MTQKVLKVGSSAAVTIPKAALKELGLKAGDSVRLDVDIVRRRVVIAPSANDIEAKINPELRAWTKKFIERYRPALEALAKQ